MKEMKFRYMSLFTGAFIFLTVSQFYMKKTPFSMYIQQYIVPKLHNTGELKDLTLSYGRTLEYEDSSNQYVPINQTFGSSKKDSYVKFSELPDVFKDDLTKDKLNKYVNLLDVPRPEYLENYRNPCWNEKLQRANKSIIRMRCLPYVYYPGFPKTGTTDMFFHIGQHPQIPKTNKAPHWWSWSRIGYRGWKPFYKYINSYNRNAEELKIMLNYSHKQGLLMDASPSILWSNFVWPRLQENRGCPLESGPCFHVGDYIAHMTPHAQLIITMRNPVDREYSWYMYNNNKLDRISAEDFHDKVVRSLHPMKECLRVRPAWSCVNDVNITDIVPKRHVRLQLGMYSVWLKEWFKSFPRDHFHFNTLADYSANRTKVLESVFRFLGLDYINTTSDRPTKNEVKNSSKRKKVVAGAMLPNTRSLLEEFYKPFNKQLADLLQDEKYLFLD